MPNDTPSKDVRGGRKNIKLLDERNGMGVTGLVPAPVWAGTPPAAEEWSLSIDMEAEQGMVHARARITNQSARPLRVALLRWGADLSVKPPIPPLLFPRKLRPCFVSSENYRRDFLLLGTQIGPSFFEPLPNARIEIGWSEDQVFPCVWIGSAVEKTSLLVAAATAEIFQPVFRIGGVNVGNDRWMFEIDERPSGTEFVEIPPGATLSGERLCFLIAYTDDPQAATRPYYRLLRNTGGFARRKRNPLREQRIYCTWNYDFFENITEKDVLAQLPVLREHFPQVKFIQLDDGYQSTPHGRRAMLDFLYDGDCLVDREKFPSGLDGLARKIREAGFRPSIWLNPRALITGRLLHDHPDWVLPDEYGHPSLMGNQATLDYSLPEVREYFDRVCRTVFSEWGYEGVKFDFSTFGFDPKRLRYQNGGSALEHRRWLVETFRKYLPEDGYFGWCLVAGTGDPLRNDADYFRCAEDVTYPRRATPERQWEMIRNIALWLANMNLLMPERTVFPNIDSIGCGMPLNEAQLQSWLNLAAISGAALEVSGDLTRPDRTELERLSRCLELSDPIARLEIADLPRGEILHPPRFWLSTEREHPLLAVFNWESEPRIIPLDPLPAETRARFSHNVWTHEKTVLGASIELPPFDSLLLAES